MTPNGIEIFEAEEADCPVCGSSYPIYAGQIPNSCCHAKDLQPTGVLRIWYWFCQPGCLPDSDPFGPFDSLAEAEADIDEKES